MKKAFTMIELVFVIVVLGILAAVAVPKFSATRDDAQIAKGRSDISAIRSAIITERQRRLIRGNSAFIATTAMDTSTTTGLFGGVLTYAMAAGTTNGHWRFGTESDPNRTYIFRVENTNVTFTYNDINGTFTCPISNLTCAKLVN